MKILVVDDDSVSCVKVAALLKSYGRCDMADDGEKAIKLFESAHKELEPYELITMDIEMPGISGQEAVNKIRETETLLNIPSARAVRIIMVTGKTALKEVSSSYYEGCNGYITKPISPQSLKSSLEEAGIVHP